MSHQNELAQTSTGLYVPKHAVENTQKNTQITPETKTPKTESYTVTSLQGTYKSNGEKGQLIHEIQNAAIYDALDSKKALSIADIEYKSAVKKFFEEQGYNVEKGLDKEIHNFAKFTRNKLYSIFSNFFEKKGFKIENKDSFEYSRAMEVLIRTFYGTDVEKVYSAALKSPERGLEVFNEEQNNAPVHLSGQVLQAYLTKFFPNKDELLEALSEALGRKVDSVEEGVNDLYMKSRAVLMSISDSTSARREYEQMLQQSNFYDKREKLFSLESVLSQKEKEQKNEQSEKETLEGKLAA